MSAITARVQSSVARSVYSTLWTDVFRFSYLSPPAPRTWRNYHATPSSKYATKDRDTDGYFSSSGCQNACQFSFNANNINQGKFLERKTVSGCLKLDCQEFRNPAAQMLVVG